MSVQESRFQKHEDFHETVKTTAKGIYVTALTILQATFTNKLETCGLFVQVSTVGTLIVQYAS